MKKTVAKIVLLVVIMALVFSLVACKGDYKGTYYKYSDGVKDDSDWIKLEKKKWSDNDGESGRLEEKDGTIYCYYEMFGEEDVLFWGTVSDGVFKYTLGAKFPTGDYIYYNYYTDKSKADNKNSSAYIDDGNGDNSGDNNGDNSGDNSGDNNQGGSGSEEEIITERTISFSTRGGNELEKITCIIGEVMTLPTPVKDGYRFLGWEDYSGHVYDNTSVMPDKNLSLYAQWEEIVTAFSDDYITFQQAAEGKKHGELLYYDKYYNSGVQTFLYIELTSDELGGVDRVGKRNNLDLATEDKLEYKLKSGYNLTWYEGDFNTPNGAQMFTLGYGSNIQLLTVTKDERVVKRYLVDIYVRYDYYISLYTSIYAEEPYTSVRVIENERFPSDTAVQNVSNFEYKERVYYNEDLEQYVAYNYDTIINKDMALYQTYKSRKMTLELNGGKVSGNVNVVPYTKKQTYATPTQEGYDFIGWKLADGTYFTDLNGFAASQMLSAENNFDKLIADFRAKTFQKVESGGGAQKTVSFVKTIPVVIFTDSSQTTIHDIQYVPYDEEKNIVPTSIYYPTNSNQVFYQYNRYNEKGVSVKFDNRMKATEGVALFPTLRDVYEISNVNINTYAVRLNTTQTFNTGESSFYLRPFLATSKQYRVKVTTNGSLTLRIEKFGEQDQRTFTINSDNPANFTMQTITSEASWATLYIYDCRGSVTVEFTGATVDYEVGNAGVVTEENSVSVGEEVTIIATTDSGYTWLGWYDGNTKVSEDTSKEFTFEMPTSEKTYTAKWYKIGIAKNISAAGTVSELDGKYDIGDEVTVTAITNNGYTWLGWYDGNTKVSEDESQELTFTMPTRNKTYTAKWAEYFITTDTNDVNAGTYTRYGQSNVSVNFNLNGASGTAPLTQHVDGTTGLVYPDIPTRSEYLFGGWYASATCTGTPYDFTADVTQDITLYAKWVSYNGYGTLNLGESVSLSVVSKSSSTVRYYAFVPLVGERITIYTTGSLDTYGYLYDSNKTQLAYDDDGGSGSNFSISYTVTAGNLYYVRPCGYNSSGTTTLNFTATQKPQAGGLGEGALIGERIAVGQEVTLTANTNNGYTWLGWYDGDEKVSEGIDLTYSFIMTAENKTYTAKWIETPVTVERNIEGAGTVTTLNGKYIVGEIVTVTANTNNGYTWFGWYDGDTKVSEGTSLLYSFTITAESKTYTAKWIETPITVEKNITSAGSVTTLNGKYAVGETVTITATTNNGYTWLGWHDGDEKVSEDLAYSFTMPAESKTYTAKWACYTVTTNTNLNGAGSYTRYSEYKVIAGNEVTLTATTNNGYTWLGWYDGNTKVSEDESLSYSFTMTAENMTYTAKWIATPITTQKNIAEAGTVTALNGKYAVGEIITVTATTNDGYTWLGWYDGDTKVSEGTDLTYSFTMTTENKSYTAKWAEYFITIDTNDENAGTYTRCVAVRFNLNGASGTAPLTQRIDETIGLVYPDIPTRSSYVFGGWYANSACIGTPYDFRAEVTQDITLYAKWVPYDGYGTLSLGSSVSLSVISKSSTTVQYYAFVPLVSERITIYTYGSLDTYGYLYDSNKTQLASDDDSGMGHNFSISYSVTAGNLYYVRPCGYSSSGTTTLNFTATQKPQAGGTACNGRISEGQEVTLIAESNDGYTWLGWYDGDIKVSEGTNLSYTFEMPAENKTYTAKWIVTPITLEKNVKEAGTVTELNGKYAVGETVTVTANTNNGYTWLGWYDGDTKVSDGTSLLYDFTMTAENKTYTAKWIITPVTLERNIEVAGTVTALNGKYAVGEIVTVAASTNNGYTWLGWYDGDTKVSDGTSLLYDFTMTAENKTYTAKWIYYTITTETNMANAGSYTRYTEQKITAGNEVNLTARTYDGYIWQGWYNGDTRLTTELSYSFTMAENSIVYTAKWVECDDHNVVDGVCTKCGATEVIIGMNNKGYYRDDNYIYFGYYPQTIKVDSVTVGNTADSDGYYLGSDGYKYAKVTATPYESGYKFSNNATVTSGTVYYFKVEPIRWRVLKESNGNAFILCDSIIANYKYSASNNNYANSEIRAWLNDKFYNKAFNSLQQAIIQITNVGNSVASTGEDTNDKIFLLSHAEIMNSEYGLSSNNSVYTAGKMQTSDYSRASGAYMDIDSRYYGNGWWWTRSPFSTYSDSVYIVRSNGYAGNFEYGYYLKGGVLPALWIKLS